MKKLKHVGKYKILVLCIWICLMSSNVFSQTESREILVFAGAGMRLPLNEIGKKFGSQHGIKVLYDFEGSGRLGNKVLVGQTPDVFIPGSDKWAKILKEKGYVDNYTPIAFHTLVIITPEENSNVTCLNDFSNPNNKIVLGDAKACAIGGGIGKPVQVFRRFVGGLYQFSNIVDRGFAGMLFRHPGGLCIGNEGF